MSYQDWDVSIINSDEMLIYNGIVVNPERAKRSYCKCIRIDEEKVMCWVPGIIGVLSQEQVVEYCPEEKRIYMPGTEIAERVKRFREASSEICVGLPLMDRLKCMSIALKRGLVEARSYAESVRAKLMGKLKARRRRRRATATQAS